MKAVEISLIDLGVAGELVVEKLALALEDGTILGDSWLATFLRGDVLRRGPLNLADLERRYSNGYFGAARVYVPTEGDVPEGSVAQRGKRGGIYYEAQARKKDQYPDWSSDYYDNDVAYHNQQAAFLETIDPPRRTQSSDENALTLYKHGRGSRAINDFLRGQRPDIRKVNQRLLARLDAAFNDIPGLAQNITTYRGISPSILASLQLGNRFVDRGFTSTSLGWQIPSAWKGLGAVLRIQVPAGMKGIWMESRAHSDPQYHGPRRTEQEMLFERGREFEVLERGRINGTVMMTVRMLA